MPAASCSTFLRLSVCPSPPIDNILALGPRGAQLYFSLQAAKGAATCFVLAKVFKVCFPETSGWLTSKRPRIGPRLNSYAYASREQRAFSGDGLSLLNATAIVTVRMTVASTIKSLILGELGQYIRRPYNKSAAQAPPCGPVVEVELAANQLYYRSYMWVLNPLRAVKDGLLFTNPKNYRFNVSLSDVTNAIIAILITDAVCVVAQKALFASKRSLLPSLPPTSLWATAERQLVSLAASIVSLSAGRAIMGKFCGGGGSCSNSMVPFHLPSWMGRSQIAITVTLLAIVGHSLSLAVAEDMVLGWDKIRNSMRRLANKRNKSGNKTNTVARAMENEFALVVGYRWDDLTSANLADIELFMKTVIIDNTPSRATVQYGAIRTVQLINNISSLSHHSSQQKQQPTVAFTAPSHAPSYRSDPFRKQSRRVEDSLEDFNEVALRLFDSFDIVYSELSRLGNDSSELYSLLVDCEYAEDRQNEGVAAADKHSLLSHADVVRSLEPQFLY